MAGRAGVAVGGLRGWVFVGSGGGGGVGGGVEGVGEFGEKWCGGGVEVGAASEECVVEVGGDVAEGLLVGWGCGEVEGGREEPRGEGEVVG